MSTTVTSAQTISIEGQQEARAIQLAVLASEPLTTAGISIESEFQPFSEVGGDFLDYFVLCDGTAGLYLGDVTGKGLPAGCLRRWGDAARRAQDRDATERGAGAVEQTNNAEDDVRAVCGGAVREPESPDWTNANCERGNA